MKTHIASYALRPPYAFSVTAANSHFSSPLGVWRDGRYRRALRCSGGIALVELSGAAANPSSVDACVLATRGSVDFDTLTARVNALLNPTLELAPFYAVAQRDPLLWAVVTPLAGLGLFTTETVFEALAMTVIEQQIALSAAQRAERWLIEWGGEGIDFEGRRYSVFPSAERIAAASVEALTPMKITFRRMAVLIRLAQAEASASLERLRALPHEAAYAELMRLNGVGHWTAAWTLARGLGQIIYVGSADVALRAAVNAYFYGLPGRSDAATTDAHFARYGDFAGLAAYYTLMRWATERYPDGTTA